MNYIHDNRINADNYSDVMTLGEYYDLIKDCLIDNEYQRRRVRNSGSIYNLLKQDIIKGCIMPPIVLAICDDQPEVNNLKDLLRTNSGKIKILDGLQRSYTIKEVINEYHNALWNETNPLNNLIRVEVYVGINKLGILYRMLTLNAGQTRMSTRHQIEIIYSEYKNNCDVPGVRLLTELDNVSPRELGEYKFRDVVEGFTSFLQKDYLPLDRQDILDSVRDLERVSTVATSGSLFYDFVNVYHHLVYKLSTCNSICWNDDQLCHEAGIYGVPFANTFTSLLNKSQSLTGFGCAVAELIDRKTFFDIKFLHDKIESINNYSLDAGFIRIIANLEWIRSNAKKIGNDQRKFFYCFFLVFLDPYSPTFMDFTLAVDKAYDNFKNLGHENSLF